MRRGHHAPQHQTTEALLGPAANEVGLVSSRYVPKPPKPSLTYVRSEAQEAAAAGSLPTTAVAHCIFYHPVKAVEAKKQLSKELNEDSKFREVQEFSTCGQLCCMREDVVSR